MMDPELISEMGETALEHGVDIVEEGPELLEQVGEGMQETAHAIFYPVDTAEKVIDYFKGPEASAPNIELPTEDEEVTMRSSSVAHDDPPPPAR